MIASDPVTIGQGPAVASETICSPTATSRRRCATPLCSGSGPAPSTRRPPHLESIEVGLVEAGTRASVATRLRGDAMLDLASWIRAADTAGMPRARIARLAGLNPTHGLHHS